MAREIIPQKLIVSLNEDGSVKESTFVYRMSVDGQQDSRRLYTMGVKAGIGEEVLRSIMGSAKDHAELGEGIISQQELDARKGIIVDEKI